MAKHQVNIRASDLTRDKLDFLSEYYGTQAEAVAVAVDRLYRETRYGYGEDGLPERPADEDITSSQPGAGIRRDAEARADGAGRVHLLGHGGRLRARHPVEPEQVERLLHQIAGRPRQRDGGLTSLERAEDLPVLVGIRGQVIQLSRR